MSSCKYLKYCERDRLEAEIQRLQAENERLKSDAENVAGMEHLDEMLKRRSAIPKDDPVLKAAEPYLTLMRKAKTCIDGPLPDRWHYLHEAEKAKAACTDAVFAALEQRMEGE